MTGRLEDFNPLELAHLRQRKPIWLTDDEYRSTFSQVPRLCADGVVVTDDDKRVLLIQRSIPPTIGKWCLPGGKKDLNEKLEDTVKRKVYDETGIYVDVDRTVGLRGLVGVYDDPLIDRVYWQRGRGYQIDPDWENTFTDSTGVTYLVRQVGGTLRAGKDTGDVSFFYFENLPGVIASHHFDVLQDAYKLLRRVS
ncbi:MAG: NUDIX domain-containing protein [Candidatus Aenigmarchaeota archaeon]|nr:NUDIX domain-containing protein [Candidatus Aenigmarchaeota archaeon]